jgi:hypothetical protein
MAERDTQAIRKLAAQILGKIKSPPPASMRRGRNGGDEFRSESARR